MKPTKQLISYIRDARSRGVSLNRICREVGISLPVIGRWVRQGFMEGANG